jgi:hypothetical protein
MSETPSQIGDTYQAPEGVVYTLIEASAMEDDDILTAVSLPHVLRPHIFASAPVNTD